MPFITEEIWQKVRQPLGIEGASIMQQTFPVATGVDAQAESDIDWLKQVLQGIRRIRSELDLAPSQQLMVELQAGDPLDRARIDRFGTWLSSLGRVSAFHWVGNDADTSQSAVALVGELKLLIPLAGLVDVAAELMRIKKLMAREDSDRQRSKSKISNRKFVENAPPEVVEQEKERLAVHEANMQRLKQQLEQLENLKN